MTLVLPDNKRVPAFVIVGYVWRIYKLNAEATVASLEEWDKSETGDVFPCTHSQSKSLYLLGVKEEDYYVLTSQYIRPALKEEFRYNWRTEPTQLSVGSTITDTYSQMYSLVAHQNKYLHKIVKLDFPQNWETEDEEE